MLFNFGVIAFYLIVYVYDCNTHYACFVGAFAVQLDLPLLSAMMYAFFPV